MDLKTVYNIIKQHEPISFEHNGIKFTNFRIGKNENYDRVMMFTADTEGAHVDAYCTSTKNKINPTTIKYSSKEEINNILKTAISIADKCLFFENMEKVKG